MTERLPKRPKGLRIKEVREGAGAIAGAGSVVLVHYECFLPRGDSIERSRDRGFPAQFRVGKRQVMPALEHGVPGMAVGGFRTITVGPQLTYYERRQHPDLPEGVALRYEVELVRVSETWDNSLYEPEAP